MTRYRLHFDKPDQMHATRQLVEKRFGPEAATVFYEASDNLEHVPGHIGQLLLGKECFVVISNSQLASEQSSKPEGSGGYGLLIIRALGGIIGYDQHGTAVAWANT